jgi:hypothetical protein
VGRLLVLRKKSRFIENNLIIAGMELDGLSGCN